MAASKNVIPAPIFNGITPAGIQKSLGTVVWTLGEREITEANSKMFSQRIIFPTFIPGIFSKSLKSRVTTENPKEMQVAPIIRS